MVEFNASILAEAAERFEKQAKRLILEYSVKYAFYGFLVGAILVNTIVKNPSSKPTVLWVVALIGLAQGYSTGKEKAFMLRLEAQKCIALQKIEENTRK